MVQVCVKMTIIRIISLVPLMNCLGQMMQNAHLAMEVDHILLELVHIVMVLAVLMTVSFELISTIKVKAFMVLLLSLTF